MPLQVAADLAVDRVALQVLVHWRRFLSGNMPRASTIERKSFRSLRHTISGSAADRIADVLDVALPLHPAQVSMDDKQLRPGSAGAERWP